MKGDKYFNIVDLDDFVKLADDAIECGDVEEQRKLLGIFEGDYCLNNKRLSKQVDEQFQESRDWWRFQEKLEFMLHREVKIDKSLEVDENTSFVDVVAMIITTNAGDWALKLSFRSEIDKYLDINREKLDGSQVSFLENKRLLLQKAALENIVDIDVD